MPELMWDGKYDAIGKRPAPLRMGLPFQTVETVNESAQERQRSLLFADDRPADWRNRLIWGDKKYVLPALLGEFAGQVDLIYIDPRLVPPVVATVRPWASATTLVTMAPTVRHAMRISSSTAERLVCLASQANWSSNITVCLARCLAQGKATTTIPCSGQRTRGASASR